MNQIHIQPLELDNLFDCAQLLGAIGVQELLGCLDRKEIAALTASGQGEAQVGMMVTGKLCGVLLRRLPQVKGELLHFLAGCCRWEDGRPVTVEALRHLPPAAFARLMRELFAREEFADFFGVLAAPAATDP